MPQALLSTQKAKNIMLDITYLAATLLFFAACWLLTKACEKL